MDENELRAAMKAGTTHQKKAFIFAVGWWLRKLHGFKKYPDAYKAAKDNIGLKSVVFGVPQWPKKFERGPLQNQMRMFYTLMEQSLENQDYRIDSLVRSLLQKESYYYHKFVKPQVCAELWQDALTDLNKMTKLPLQSHSVALAKSVFEKEDFAWEINILCDSLDDSGHDFESAHLRTGKHTPACPVLRKIAGIVK